MSLRDCERCGSDDNVTKFTHFDGQPKEWLCWDCRWPIIEDRLRPDDETEEADEEPDGQSTLFDY